MRIHPLVTCALILMLCLPATIGAAGPASDKPPITIDEFFDSVSFGTVRISPDGNAVVIQADRADWDENRFRSDLWLYRAGELSPLTQSGHDHAPQWSPDGRWIAFISDRSVVVPKKKSEKEEADPDSEDTKEESVDQLYVISAAGGEAFPVTEGDEAVHSFAWSADSRSIFFAAKIELTTQQKKDQKNEWKDVLRYRESERGDFIRRVDVAAIQAERSSGKILTQYGDQTKEIAKIADRAKSLCVSTNGERLAFFTEPRSERQESLDEYAIYVIELSGNAAPAEPRVVSRSQAVYDAIRWAEDNRHVFFIFESGAVEGAYQDAQQRVYWVDAGAPGTKQESAAPSIARWAGKFNGAVAGFNVLPSGGLLVAGHLGTEVQPYTQADPGADFVKQKARPGTYEEISISKQPTRVAFVYSTLEKPAEVYVADSVGDMANARAITSFNRVFTEHAMPQGKPYRWTADDGATVEGMLIYPPGKMGAKNLRMLTFIHGGPEDADGDHFEADWYQWALLAATHGWLVFEPNYRGSVGYGDAFALGIIPHIVSRPGKDILEGVDALVKDGIADPKHLTVGGYSYGGYMTNWLITQTTRFKAAVTGAGAVEHVANWGNDDVTMDDAYFLGGKPWEAEANYNAEAAIWQFDKVTTPTHVVGGADDIRVYVGEDYLLERALHARGIPSSLLIFPGEGHSLDKNPWHGKIKVRDELIWLEKYGTQ
ncbi:MAG TPA: prolyl oligopeptidase family serine peptidase [Candidatus Acidoferrales bacterium]